MTLARTVVLGLLLALAAGIAARAFTALVAASGAQAQPAVVLTLLLAAFLGVLTAVATRLLGLPGATAPTALVLAYTIVAGVPIPPFEAPSLALPSIQALAPPQVLGLAVASIAATVTLAVPGDSRR